MLNTPWIYSNDEKTRTFLGINVTTNIKCLKSYVEDIDKSLAEFRLPVYYKDPSFHISLAWAVGDLQDKITSDMMEVLQVQFNHIKMAEYVYFIECGYLLCQDHRTLIVLIVSLGVVLVRIMHLIKAWYFLAFQMLIDEFFTDNPTENELDIKNLKLKTGNKIFYIPLAKTWYALCNLFHFIVPLAPHEPI